MNPSSEFVTFDCLTEALQRRALELDGSQMVDHLGLPMGTISVGAVKNTPLSYLEIVRIVDTQVWVDREMKRLAPSDSKSTHQEPKEAEEPRKSYAKVVESEPRPRTPPKRVTPSPSSSPKGGGQESSRASAKRPQTWCFVCEKAQRNSLHDHRTCKY